MIDLRALDSILSTRNGVWTLVLLAILTLWRGWPHIPAIIAAWSARRKAISDEKDADWTRIRNEAKHYSEDAHRYADRLAIVERECADTRRLVRECEEREVEWRRRAIEAEAKILGVGLGRQSVAEVEAARRADPAKATEAMKRFNGDKGEGK